MITEIPISQTAKYSLEEAIRGSWRPVTILDTWCSFSYKDTESDFPYGSIYTIPYGNPIDLSWLTGYIIRTKKIGDEFLIQVVLMNKKNRKYSIRCLRVETRKRIGGCMTTVYKRLINIKSKNRH